MNRSATILFPFVCCVSALAQFEPAEVVSPRAVGPIVLDGRLSDDAWKAAADVGPLVTLGSMRAPDGDVTHAKLLHDDGALYLTVVCRAAAKPAKTSRSRRDHLWPDSREDRLEIFLNPLPESTDQYHLDVTRDGVRFDVWNTERDVPRKGKQWQGDWQAATAETGDGWAAEIRLPYGTFGVKSVQAGDCWRFRLGRDTRAQGVDGPIMWPPNPTRGFGSRDVDACLYFETPNLLKNGDFETGEVVRGVPRPWRGSLTRSSEGITEPQGTLAAVQGGCTPGKRALRYAKHSLLSNLPQVWDYGYRLTPGGIYEYSIMAKGTMARFTLRVSCKSKGQRIRMGRNCQPSRTFSRYAFRFVVPDETETVEVGLGASREVYGEMLYDHAVLRRVLHADESTVISRRSYAPPSYRPTPDPVQGLDAFCERAGHKPWDLYWRDDHLLSHRLIFRDRKYGTWLWMIDNSPSSQPVVTASLWSGWNADGSVLYVHGVRPTAKGGPKRWLCNADFSRLTEMPPAGDMPIWDLEDPAVYYYFVKREPKVGKVNIRTGEHRVLTTLPLRFRNRAYGLTKDNRSVFVTDHDGGLWVPYAPGDEPQPYDRVLDTSGVAPNRKESQPSRGLTLEDERGHLIRILIGTRVYTDTGRTERVIAPISGNTDYLRIFASGRIQFPADAAPPKTTDLDELFAIYHLYPSCSHGHVSYSPNGEYLCWDGGPSSYRVRDRRDRQDVSISPNGPVYHVCWFHDPRFYVTCVAGFLRRYERCIHADLLCQAFSDGTWQPVTDIKLRPYVHYHGANFATLSRDATKIHYGSSMTGVPKNYIAILARPQPPRDVTWRAVNGAVALAWQAPPHHREIAGHLIYRSERSGDGYQLLTPQPVTGATYRDATLEHGRPYYYVVTSIEHCGIESGYSAEAACAGIGLPARIEDSLVVYVEAEDALVDLATGDKPGVSRGRDVLGASNWYYVYRSPKASLGKALLSAEIPAEAEYAIWLRVRRGSDREAKWQVHVGDRVLGEMACPKPQWCWVRAGAARLQQGRVRLTLSCTDAGAQADAVCLASDANFVPRGVRPEDREAPTPVQNLRAEPVGDRQLHLTWRTNREPDLSHYNVYSSRSSFDTPSQERLIASPTRCELIDWGLRAGTTYHYAVTAVDRCGNESALDDIVNATTQPRPYPPQAFELRFDKASLAGRFELSEGKGTRAEKYAIISAPPAPSGETASTPAHTASWQLDIKHAGRYHFWLRYLPRGAGAGDYTPTMRQTIRALLDGKRLATIAGGLTDLSVADSNIRPEFWTWSRLIVAGRLTAIDLPAGRRTLTLQNLCRSIRYDVLVITDEPSFQPADGRLHQR